MDTSLRTLTLVVLAALSGCWVTADEIDEKLGDRPDLEGTDTESESETDTETDLDDLEVLTVAPAHGSTAGGTQVVVTVDIELDDSTVVTFGGVEATIVEIDGDEVTVSTPEADDDGSVAVKVVTDTHSGRQTKAFTYWQDGEGELGVIGEISWTEVLGDYWKDGTDPYSSAWIALAEPHTSPEHMDLYGGSLDNCTTSPTFTLPTLYEPDVDEVVLASSRGDTTLDGSDGYFSVEELDISSHPEGVSFDLEIDEASDYPAVAMEVGTMPALPGLYYPDVDASTLDYLYEDAILAWDTEEPADYVVLELIAVYGEGSSETVSCVLQDDGYEALSTSALWSSYENADYVLIYMGRVSLGSNDALLQDQTRSGVAAISWEVGAALP